MCNYGVNGTVFVAMMPSNWLMLLLTLRSLHTYMTESLTAVCGHDV
jgi:hypothetical protein